MHGLLRLPNQSRYFPKSESRASTHLCAPLSPPLQVVAGPVKATAAQGHEIKGVVKLAFETRGPRAQRLLCRSVGHSGDSEDEQSSTPASEASGEHTPPAQQSKQLHTPISQQVDSAAASQPAQYSPEQQLLHVAMKKLQALENYQQLLANCSNSQGSGTAGKGGSRHLQRKPGDTPAEVADKIAADRDEVPLLDAAILIAQHAYPDLEAASVKQQLDDLAGEVERALPDGARYPLRVLKEINRVLYEVHGFKGNTEDYYSPDNSCINRVLETKRGIPISLSLVYMEVAARVGLPMAGVNLPAHFMIRPQVEGMEWLVDAFNAGELTSLQDAEEVLGGLIGYQVKLDPRFVSGDTPPLSSRAFLLRLLNNLRQIYVTLNMAEDALSIVRYMRATAPTGSLPELSRDEGLCLYSLGRWPEATEALHTFLDSSPDQRDAALVTALLDKIKERAAAAAAAAAAASAAGDGRDSSLGGVSAGSEEEGS